MTSLMFCDVNSQFDTS